MRRRLLGLLWIVLALLAAAWLVRSFVADVYFVESGSMEPTVRGGEEFGEWVIVTYGGAEELERFDLAVVFDSARDKAVVKRVAGLPGERVLVSEGDLFIDGERLGPGVRRPEPVVLFDSDRHALAEQFVFDDERWLPGSTEADRWRLDARGHATPSDRAGESNLLSWRNSFDDGYLLPDGRRVIGTRAVSDGRIDWRIVLLERAGTLRLELREEGDLFRAEVELGEDATIARIRRLHPERAAEVLAEVELARDAVPVGAELALSFANVDNSLVLVVGEAEPVVATYADNRVPAGPAVAPGRTIGTQVAVGGDGVHLELVGIAIARDMHWTERGAYAVDGALALGPGEYFLLGDNSVHSVDGRSFGATGASEILGRATGVVWPRDRARDLDAGWTPSAP